jgi:Domain of unknown function (DUF4919)
MKIQILAGICACLLSFVSLAQPTPTNDAMVAAMQQQREALFDARNLNVAQLSGEITSAVREAEKLEREGQYQQALDRFKVLEKFMPLLNIPSFDLHMLCGWLNMKLNNQALTQQHQLRASALRTILQSNVGKGDSLDAPARLTMVSEILDWVKANAGRISAVKQVPHLGQEVYAVTYAGLSTNNQPRQFYAVLDKRTQAALNQTIDRYQPISDDRLDERGRVLVATAIAKRNQFLDDRTFNYLELAGELREIPKAMDTLLSQNNFSDAMAKLKTLEKYRVLGEIPTPELLSTYSFLAGKLGDTTKQTELRGLIFGVQQAIARSGDGKSPQSAIHVIFITEEYDWLREKKLTRIQQRLLNADGQLFDVLRVKDTQGNEHEVYFNITRMYPKNSQFSELKSKPN